MTDQTSLDHTPVVHNPSTPPPAKPNEPVRGASEPLTPDRLARFERDVADLGVTGGAANPERQGGRLGMALMVIGGLAALVCWYGAYNSTRFEVIQRMIILGTIFVGMAIVGAVIWVRNSLTRYFRYWLIRLVYEQREQTDALVAAQREQMDRLIEHLHR